MKKAGDEQVIEQLRDKVQRVENERKAEKKVYESQVSALNARVCALEKDNAALKARVSALERENQRLKEQESDHGDDSWEEEEIDEEEEEEEEEEEDKSRDEVAKQGSAVFRWKEKEHQRHLSACLSNFPQELVNLVGSLLSGWEWSQERKSAGILLSTDDNGLQRVAYFRSACIEARSVLSDLPLSPSSSSFSTTSSPSSFSPECPCVAAFEVRVDRCRYGLSIGVSGCLPPDFDAVGGEGYGVAYLSNSYVVIHGAYARLDGECLTLAQYSAGDVIRVEVDFSARTVAFFKNGELKDRPIDVSDFNTSGIDLAKPLYAAVSMQGKGDQVTLL